MIVGPYFSLLLFLRQVIRSSSQLLIQYLLLEWDI